MNIIQHSQSIINTVRTKTNRVMLFYSCGKDSIAMLDMVVPYFEEVVCVYMYFVKELRHIDTFIRNAELRYPNVRFLKIPHWNLTHIISAGAYCRVRNLKRLSLSDVIERMRLQTGIEWCFLGMKQSDNMNRRIMLRTPEYENEAINNKSKLAYPLSRWGNKEVQAYCRQRLLPEPITYSKNKKSQGLIFDEDVFAYLRKNYPDDLQKIYAVFPESKIILYRYDNRVKQTFQK